MQLIYSERQYYFKLVDLGKMGHDKYICIQNYLAAGYVTKKTKNSDIQSNTVRFQRLKDVRDTF